MLMRKRKEENEGSYATGGPKSRDVITESKQKARRDGERFGANDGEPLASSGKRGAASEEIVFCNSTPQPLTCPSMPLYEHICRKCHNKFDEVLTIKEHETKKVQCPKCQSTDLEKVIEPFFAKTASKTRRY